MTRKLYDLTIASGTYSDRNGNEKTTWQNVGAVFETENGRKFLTIKRTFNPAGVPVDEAGANREAIFINLFKADSRKGD